MPFKHIVDKEKNIVVLKATGKVSLTNIINEIEEANVTLRGDGIKRRLIDITNQEISFSPSDAQLILKMINTSSKMLGFKKIAILIKELPDNLDVHKLISQLDDHTVEIGLFTDKAKAAEFLSKPYKSYGM